jgi:putative membrane protein
MSSSTERAAPGNRGVALERRRRPGGVRAGAAPVRLRRAPWRVVVARVVVNALAVALVVLVLPGVQVTVRHPVLGYLAIGAVFGLINAFVKPAIQFVALPLLLGSMGLVVLVVDVVVFWVLVRVSPILHTTGALWVVLAGVLLGLLSYLLDNLLGLVPPILSDHPGEGGHR